MPGYNVFNLAEIQKDYLCIICKLILREPKQTFCGHRICESCFTSEIENKSTFTCRGENCNEQISKKNVFLDQSFKRNLLELKIGCPNQCCNWQGSIQDYDKHEKNCECRIVKCTHLLCDVEIVAKSLKFHLNQECEYRFIKCKFCSAVTEARKLKAHFNDCFKYPCECLHCKSRIPREEMELHIHPILGVCTKMIIPCPFNAIGCSTKHNMNYKEREKHFKDNLIPHMRQLLSRNLSQAKSKDEDWETHELASDIMAIKRKLQNIEKDIRNEGDRNTCYSIAISELNDKVKQLIPNQFLPLEPANGLNLTNPVNINGNFIWKITSFAEKRRQAIDKIKTSFYSEPFYTNIYGYKMCLRIYLNGDGIGENTHISLFFVVMQGQFDALLSWPFKKIVTFYFVNQNSRLLDVCSSFKSDVTSNSFQKPRMDMNIASGCPFFFPLTKLEESGYVVDDTIFIKALVE